MWGSQLKIPKSLLKQLNDWKIIMICIAGAFLFELIALIQSLVFPYTSVKDQVATAGIRNRNKNILDV